MKEFDTPDDNVERAPHDFKLRGEVFQAYEPKLSSLSQLLPIAQLTPETMTANDAFAMTGFVEDCLTDESRERVLERFADPADRLDLSDLVPVIEWLIELATGGKAPTSSKGSSPARKRTGTPSTARPRSKASTRAT